MKIKMQKIKKPVPIPKNMRIKTFCQNIQKTLMINCLKNTIDFNSFINEFVRTTNEEDKQKVVEKLKYMGSFVNHDIERNRNSENIFTLIDIVNAIDYFLDEYSKK